MIFIAKITTYKKRVKNTCQKIFVAYKRIYETLLIFTILMSSIALVFEDIHLNSQKRSTLKIVLYWADVFFCVFFGVEMIMKIVAYGMRKYFTNWWCCLDFFIVAVSVISIYYSEMPHSKAKRRTSTTSSSLSVLRVLRTMRALRKSSKNKMCTPCAFFCRLLLMNALFIEITSAFDFML